MGGYFFRNKKLYFLLIFCRSGFACWGRAFAWCRSCCFTLRRTGLFRTAARRFWRAIARTIQLIDSHIPEVFIVSVRTTGVFPVIVSCSSDIFLVVFRFSCHIFSPFPIIVTINQQQTHYIHFSLGVNIKNEINWSFLLLIFYWWLYKIYQIKNFYIKHKLPFYFACNLPYKSI